MTTKSNEVLGRLRSCPIEGDYLIITDPQIKGHVVERPKWLENYSDKDILGALLQLGLKVKLRMGGAK